MVKVRKQQTYRDNIHNSLKNGAYYYKCRIEQRLESDDREGMNFDIASGLLFLAFSVESVINFIGEKKVDGWIENQVSCNGKKRKLAFKSKRRCVQKAIGFVARPYGDVLPAVNEVKEFRDIMAHGKPKTVPPKKNPAENDPVENDWEPLELKPGDDSQFEIDIAPEWETYLDPNKYFKYYNDIMKYIDAIMEASGIPELEQFSYANASINMIEE